MYPNQLTHVPGGGIAPIHFRVPKEGPTIGGRKNDMTRQDYDIARAARDYEGPEVRKHSLFFLAPLSFASWLWLLLRVSPDCQQACTRMSESLTRSQALRVARFSPRVAIPCPRTLGASYLSHCGGKRPENLHRTRKERLDRVKGNNEKRSPKMT